MIHTSRIWRAATEAENSRIIPENMHLFTAYANSLYTTIGTYHTLQVLGAWIYVIILPKGFPIEGIQEATILIMRNNIFEWGDLYFLQLLGMAMGTSCACMWATIYFAVRGMGYFILKYDSHIPLFLWYKDHCRHLDRIPRWNYLESVQKGNKQLWDYKLGIRRLNKVCGLLWPHNLNWTQQNCNTDLSKGNHSLPIHQHII